jgi:hypothetical protein
VRCIRSNDIVTGKGDKVRIEAKIGVGIFQSVDLLFSMGFNAGKIEVSVLLKEARILDTQKQ